MEQHGGLEVYDPRLAAGRGLEFSAAHQKALRDKDWDDLDGWSLPINHRADDSLDAAGLTVASTSTAIAEDNKGFQMLQRMGWRGPGVGLGREETGIAEPIGRGVEQGLRLGLGKAEEDQFYTAAENIVRKRLEVEVQADEDEDRTRQREMLVERRERILADTTTARRNLYCETCHKQYTNASELETHLSSYDHHHKKRLQEMKAMNSERTRRDRDRKERKRAEKEAAKLDEQIRKAHANAGHPALGPEAAPPLPPAAPLPPPPPDDAAPAPPPPPLPELCYSAAAAGPLSGTSAGLWNEPGQALSSQIGSAQLQRAACSRSGQVPESGLAGAVLDCSAGAPRFKFSAGGTPGAKPGASRPKPAVRKGVLKPAVAGFGLDDSDNEG